MLHLRTGTGLYYPRIRGYGPRRTTVLRDKAALYTESASNQTWMREIPDSLFQTDMFVMRGNPPPNLMK